MSSHRKPVDYEALARKGQLIIALNVIAARYTNNVLNAMTLAKQKLPDPAHMKLGVVQALKTINSHTPVDYALLESYSDDDLCRSINEAIENVSTAGMFKEGYKPDWVE
jgi:sensor domain CHASE-containing protein